MGLASYKQAAYCLAAKSLLMLKRISKKTVNTFATINRKHDWCNISNVYTYRVYRRFHADKKDFLNHVLLTAIDSACQRMDKRRVQLQGTNEYDAVNTVETSLVL